MPFPNLACSTSVPTVRSTTSILLLFELYLPGPRGLSEAKTKSLRAYVKLIDPLVSFKISYCPGPIYFFFLRVFSLKPVPNDTDISLNFDLCGE